ncbi:protein of unknown function [Nitratireductor aquimarinus]
MAFRSRERTCARQSKLRRVVMTATSGASPVTMERASALGCQPTCSAAFRMRSRVSGAMRPLPVKARLTSACETFATRATSWEVAVPDLRRDIAQSSTGVEAVLRITRAEMKNALTMGADRRLSERDPNSRLR